MDALSRIVTLLRFLAFIAVVYLSLHVIFARLISRRDSKVLWFFSVLTLPLTRPVARWMGPAASQAGLRYVSMAVYGLIWLVFVVLDNALKR